MSLIAVLKLWNVSKVMQIIVKLRQGSGKDRHGMALKAKGLKALQSITSDKFGFYSICRIVCFTERERITSSNQIDNNHYLGNPSKKKSVENVTLAGGEGPDWVIFHTLKKKSCV